HNVKLNFSFFLMTVLLLSSALATSGQAAQQNQTAQAQPAAQPQAVPATADGTAVNQIIDRIVAREAILVVRMKSSHPLVETYLQSLDKDDALAFHPVGDKYFLGKLDFAKEEREQTMLKKEGIARGLLGKVSQLYSVKYLPGGFAQMLVVNGHFDRKT